MASLLPQKEKPREFFPKKGAKRKALMFLPNLLRVRKEQRASIYRKVLKSKKGAERAKLIEMRKTLKSREGLFRVIDSTVQDYQSKNHHLEGVILFGGTAKRTTSPTDLDIILVGPLIPSEKKEFLNRLESNTKMVPDTPFFQITTENAKEVFKQYLSKSLPYFSSQREWTIQNFFGPIQAKRKMIAAFSAAKKELASKKQLYNGKTKKRIEA